MFVVQGEIDAGDGSGCVAIVRRRGGRDAEQLGLDLSGLGGVGGDLGQRRTRGGEGDRGDEAFDDRAIGEHDGAVAGVAAQLEGQFCAEHGAAEVHDDEYALGRSDTVDGFFDSGGVGAEHVAVETGGDLDRWRCATDHLQGELDGGVGQAATVGNDDDPDHGELTSRMCGRRLRTATQRKWRRDPGGRRCARRDSWPDPCGPPSGWCRRGRGSRPATLR